MNPEGFPAGREGEPRSEEAAINRLQLKAATEAHTVGSFQTNFKRMVKTALDEGELQDKELAEGRLTSADDIRPENQSTKLDTTEAGVLGHNTIGGGDSGARLSRNMLANVGVVHDAEDVAQTVAHEQAHGDQVQLHGELVLNGKEISHEELYEGDAETRSNKAIGKSLNAQREGQPEELYATGQRAAVQIIQKAGRTAFERALTQDGDLDRLQREIDYAVAS